MKSTVKYNYTLKQLESFKVGCLYSNDKVVGIATSKNCITIIHRYSSKTTTVGVNLEVNPSEYDYFKGELELRQYV